MLYDLGPRAQHVYEELLARIRSGELAPGTRLPAHTQLAARFGVAPLTVRQVLARLEADGRLARERGRGTFVRAANAPSVLIVAADPALRADLDRQVRRAGKLTLLAATPAEALAALEREAPPSLVVVELHLPEARNGLSLVRTLRERMPDLELAVLNPTISQGSRLEHTVAPPLLIVGDSPLAQLSEVLGRLDAQSDGVDMLLEQYVAVQLTGERAAARALMMRQRAGLKLSVAELYQRVLQPAQIRVGELWQANEITVAREHLATAVTEAVMVDLAGSAPRAQRTGVRVVVACVEGELHDIGALMVSDLLELDGFTVRFLGADTPTDSLVRIVREESARLVVLSAAMAERLEALRAAVGHVREIADSEVRIFVGGQIMRLAGDAARALEVDLAAEDAMDTLSEARRLLAPASTRLS